MGKACSSQISGISCVSCISWFQLPLLGSKAGKPFWRPMTAFFSSNRKLLIGVVHLRPLPGSPRWQGDLDSAIEQAVKDARAYERGGAHAVFIENFGDVPFTKASVGPETVAAMAAAGLAILASGKLPIGFNVLRNNARAALALCAACQGNFIRANVHIGALLTDTGLIEAHAS